MLSGYDLFAQTNIEIHALFGLSAPIHWSDDVRDYVAKPISKKEQQQILSLASRRYRKEFLLDTGEWLFSDSPALVIDESRSVREVYFTDFSRGELEKRLRVAA